MTRMDDTKVAFGVLVTAFAILCAIAVVTLYDLIAMVAAPGWVP